jgi:hypothetical protein
MLTAGAGFRLGHLRLRGLHLHQDGAENGQKKPSHAFHRGEGMGLRVVLAISIPRAGIVGEGGPALHLIVFRRLNVQKCAG